MMKGGARLRLDLDEGWCETLHDITIHHIETWPWWRVVWDFTWHNNTSHWDSTLMKGGVRLYMKGGVRVHEGWRREVVTKGSGDEGKWWRREVVTKGSGDDGKWWRREVVTKGSGDDGKWWRREVVTMGSGDEGKWWRREVVTKGSGDDGKWTKGSGDDGKWWRREVVTEGSGDDGKWWRREVMMKGSGDEGKWWRREVVTKGSGDEGKWWRREVVTKGSGDEGKWWRWEVLPQCNGGFTLLWVCLCVRSYRVFWNLCLQIALEWLHDVARAVFWGGSRSTNPCVFPCKVAAAGDERYLVCAAVAAGVGLSFFFCRIVTVASSCFGCACVCVVIGCFGICACRSHWNGCMMLQGLCFGEEAGARILAFFRVKWLQPAMKGTSSVRRLRLGSVYRFFFAAV